jgi:hypothetical protein
MYRAFLLDISYLGANAEVMVLKSIGLEREGA